MSDSVDNDHHFHHIDGKNSYLSKGEKDNAMFIYFSRPIFLIRYYFYGNGKDKTNGVLSTFVVSAEVVERS